MSHSHIERRLHKASDVLVHELIAITPESMSEIQFEIIATDDGGADIGLLENHPDVTKVALSDVIYRAVSDYLPLIKQYVSGWTRSLLVLRQKGEQWDVEMKFERDKT